PSTRRPLRDGCIDSGVVSFFTECLIHRALKLHRGRHKKPLVRFDKNQFSGGLPETEKERTIPWMRGGEAMSKLNPVRCEMSRVQAEVDLSCVLSRRVFQRQNFLRKDFRLILIVADLACYEDRLIGHE